jgi:hypothetical protein
MGGSGGYSGKGAGNKAMKIADSLENQKKEKLGPASHR